MTEESSASSTHLFVAITTTDVTQVTGENSATSTSSRDNEFYFRCVVIVLGIVGTGANGLVLYALVASKQHHKHVLLVNQNVFDLFSSVSLVVTYAVKISKIPLSDTLGYWICIALLSEKLIWCGIIGSVINLAIITVERYLKIVHPIWSKKKLRRWVIYLAMTFAWIASVVYNVAVVFPTSSVTGGACNSYAIWKNEATKLVLFVWKFVSFYVVVLLVCVFCYWRILRVIRRQAAVMASHHGAEGGPSTAQARSNQMQSSVVKTMIFVSVFYAVSWLPTYIYLLLVNLQPGLPILKTGYYMAEFISWLYVCSNPFIYAAKFSPVKNVLLAMIPCNKMISAEQTADVSGSNVGLGTSTATSRAARSRY